jgi:iron complex outermembrane receptor protein
MCAVALGAAHLCLSGPVVAGENPGEAGEERKHEEQKQEQNRAEPENAEGQAEQARGEPDHGERKPARPLRLPSLPVISPRRPTDLPTKTSRDFIDSPSTLSVLTKREIQESGARYPSDVLRLIPGLEVQRIYSTLSNVAVRGFNDSPTTAQGVLALIDGRPAYNDFLGNSLWDQLMLIPEDLEEIEVIRGPGSFLYGPNAMHGLVNFKTKSPLDYADSEVAALGIIGSYGSALGRVRGVKRDKESGSGLLVNIVYDDIDQFEAPEEDTRNKIYGEVRYEKDLEGGSREGVKSDHRIELGAGISDQEFDLLLPTLDLFEGLPPIPSDTYANQAQELYLTGRYTHGDFVARATWTAFDSTSDSRSGIYAPFSLDLDTVDVDSRYSFRLLDDRHEVTIGGGYRFATVNTDDMDITAGRHSTNLFSAFLQDEATLVPEHLFLTAGVRVDHHSEAGASVAPRAALLWRFKKAHSLRASYGRGFRNPSLLEDWLDLPLMLPFGTATVTGNEDLNAERMDSFELGYRGWFHEDKLRVGATAYLNYIDDLVVYEMVSAATVAPVNQDEYRAYGIEVEAEYGFGESFSVFGNYAYGILEDRAGGVRIEAAPKNKAVLGLRHSGYLGESGGPTVDAAIWMTYFGETEQSFPGGVVDDYVLLNASVSFRFSKGGSAFIKVLNVLDNDHRENPEGHEYGRALEVGFQIRW